MLCGGRVDLAKGLSLSKRRLAEFFSIEAPTKPPEAPPITILYLCVIPPSHAAPEALIQRPLRLHGRLVNRPQAAFVG